MKLLHRTDHEVADVLERETLPPLPEGVTVPDDARALDVQEPRRRTLRRLLPWAGVAAIVAVGGVFLVDALRDEGTELEMRATSSLMIQESIDEALATARASVTDVADFARANGLTGLSPASMVPVES